MKRIGKKRVILMLTLLMLLSLTGCGKAKDAATDPTSQETISAVTETEPVNDTLNIIPTDMEIAVGESKTIPANYLGEKRLFWNSSDMKIATVDSQGCVTAVSETPANELTPEQFARAVVNAMVSCGMEEASGLGGWTLVTASEGELNNATAYSVGSSAAAHLYGNGRTQCNCVYIGRSGSDYQFYIQF